MPDFESGGGSSTLPSPIPYKGDAKTRSLSVMMRDSESRGESSTLSGSIPPKGGNAPVKHLLV